MLIDGLVFVRTCYACPEQYDVVLQETGEQVGYVRLRWGNLTCEYPDVGGTVIYSANIGDEFNGMFESGLQRSACLHDIAKSILKKYEISKRLT